jgi:hypothetical protein
MIQHRDRTGALGARDRKGFATVLALLLLLVLVSLAVAFAASSNVSLQQARNHRDILQARLAAESGMAFAARALRGVRSEGYVVGQPDMMGVVHEHLLENIHPACFADAGAAVTYNVESEVIQVPAITLADGRTFQFRLTVAETDGNGTPTQLQLAVVGTSGLLCRRVAVNYDVGMDKRILTYSVASRVRMLVTARTLTDPSTGQELPTIEGDLCSGWTHTHLGWYDIPPIVLEPQSWVDGKIKTVLSEEDFNEYNSGIAIEGRQDGITFDEPPIGDYAAEDFDTSAYRAQATGSLPASPDGQWSGWFPNESDRTRYLENVPIYRDRNFTNLKIPTGTNPVFINCTFDEVTYVDTDEAKTLTDWPYSSVSRNDRSWYEDRENALSNNITFMGCTFNGPVITGVPREFWWTKNALNFTNSPDGQTPTVFNNTYMAESTILAPNFNVNIGDFHDPGSASQSTLTGIIVGGIVDVRDYAEIHGTILSMAQLDIASLGSGARHYATNIGSYAGDPEVPGSWNPPAYIHIRPQPENLLPYGMKRHYTVTLNPNTYVETSP